MGLVIGTGGLHIGTSGGGASPVKRFEAEAEYIKRKAGGTDNIGTGKAKITTLKGKSLVWNQITRNGNFANSSSWFPSSAAAVTISISNNVAAVTSTTSGDYYAQQSYNQSTGGSFIPGHKYLFRGDANSPSANNIVFFLYFGSGADAAKLYSTVAEKWETHSTIFTCVTTQHNYIRLYTNVANETRYFRNIQLIDLTQMFGAGNEPATVEEFEKLFPLPYYEYNAGEIINNAAEASETVGFNQWDPQNKVVGKYIRATTGTESEGPYNHTGYVPVLPDTDYYFKQGTIRAQWGAFYDANKNYVSGLENFGGQSSLIFHTPKDAFYVRITLNQNDADNTISINLSDPNRNGTYEPYKKETIELNLPTLTGKLNGEGESVVVFPDGLKSAGTVYDEIVGNKAIKRIGVVDLGTLTWYTTETDRVSAGIVFQGTISDSLGGFNYVTPKYESNPEDSLSGIVATYGAGVSKVSWNNVGWKIIYIVDSAYSDAATFKTAMSGVLLYYELATPQEYILDTPLPQQYKVWSGGTEERLPRDTSSSVNAPVRYDVLYPEPKD